MTRDTQVASVAGAGLVAIGLLGFIPHVTTRYGALGWWGHGSRAQLVGRFQVSVLLDLVHVLAGAVLLWRSWLVGVGVALLALWLLGVTKAGGWIPLNGADDWLHLGLAVALIGLARLSAP